MANHATTRQLVQQSPEYFINKYKGQVFNYDQTGASPPQMLLDFVAMVDGDKDGKLTAEDLEEAYDIIRIAKQGKDNNVAELNYKHLPKAVSDVLKQWDADESGSVGVSELVAAGEAQKKMAQENRLVKQLLGAAGIVILILMAGTFALSLSAAEMAKDSRPGASGIQTLPDGKPVAMGKAVETKGVADFPTLSLEALTTLDSFNVVYDGKLHHFKVSGFEQTEAGDLTIFTHQAKTIGITTTGSITVDGAIVKVQDGRRLWGGSLMTSGSFTLMASGGDV